MIPLSLRQIALERRQVASPMIMLALIWRLVSEVYQGSQEWTVLVNASCYNKITQTELLKQQSFTAYGSGGWEGTADLVSGERSLSGLQTVAFWFISHGRESSGHFCLTRALILSWGLHSHDLIETQLSLKGHFSKQHCIGGQGFKIWIWVDTNIPSIANAFTVLPPGNMKDLKFNILTPF